MKLRGLIASLAAAAMALTATVSASAALCSDELAASGAPTVNAYLLAGEEGVDYSKVAKIEAVVTTSDYVNGTIGVSVGGVWTTCGQVEASAGTATWTLDGLTGIDATLDDGSLKSDVVQVQFWWLNAGTYSLDSLQLFDAEGNVLQDAAVAAEEEAPADETTEDAATGAFTAECGYSGATPATSFKVVDDVTEVKVKVDVVPADADNGWEGYNDWCGNGVVVTFEDGTKAAYQWGGAQVTWGWDADGDEAEDSEGGVNGDTWLGTIADNAVELTIPVAKNAVVEIYCLSWDSFAGTQFTVTVDGGVEAIATADEEVAEEETEEEATEEEAEEEELDAEEVLEPDWDSYDEEAMVEANEAFVFGESTAIDIYAVVGDAWADIAVIEADFVWTPGTGWCGGAGIGNGAVAADGSSWISGPEYGCANANQGLVDDGAATQVLVDLSENPLTAIASVNAETGETTFGHIQVQNWWNGVEAGAQMAAIRFLDADGEVLGEVTYDVEVPEAPEAEEEVEEEAPVVDEEAPATGDVDAATDSSKGSPDTGIEDVAVVAGLAIVAAGAVLVSKKRK